MSKNAPLHDKLINILKWSPSGDMLLRSLRIARGCNKRNKMDPEFEFVLCDITRGAKYNIGWIKTDGMWSRVDTAKEFEYLLVERGIVPQNIFEDSHIADSGVRISNVAGCITLGYHRAMGYEIFFGQEENTNRKYMMGNLIHYAFFHILKSAGVDIQTEVSTSDGYGTVDGISDGEITEIKYTSKKDHSRTLRNAMMQVSGYRRGLNNHKPANVIIITDKDISSYVVDNDLELNFMADKIYHRLDILRDAVNNKQPPVETRVMGEICTRCPIGCKNGVN